MNLAEAYKVDVICCNFAQAIYNSQHLIKSNIPIMFIEHCIYPIPNTIYRWNQGIKRGHSMFLVSKWQEKKYEQMAKRTNIDVLEITGFLNPSYCKVRRKIVEPEYDCGTIGRCDSKKSPFRLKTMTKGTDIKSLVLTSKTQIEDDLPYYEKHQDWDDVLWDLPYKEVMENISKCKTYFSTWDKETWGITSMEALSCGIPVILNCDKDGDHASEIIPADKSHYKKIPRNNKSALIDAIKNFSNVDRKEIQEMTWEKHSLDNWNKQFADAVDKTIDKFNSKKGNR